MEPVPDPGSMPFPRYAPCRAKARIWSVEVAGSKLAGDRLCCDEVAVFFQHDIDSRLTWQAEEATGIRGSGPGQGGSGGQQAPLTKDISGSSFLLHFQVQAGKEHFFDMRTVNMRHVYALQGARDTWDDGWL